MAGSFTAGTLPFTFTVREGADPIFGGGITEDFNIDLGPGLFDAPLARAFGIRRKTDGGTIDNFLEAIDGSPDDSVRQGYYAAGYADVDIEVREVPEPGLAFLSAAAAAALIRRRHLRRG